MNNSIQNSEPTFAEQVKQLVRGDLTLAQLKGITAEDARIIARHACDLAAAGLLREARVLLEGMVALNPRDAAAHAALGTVYEKQGLTAEAHLSYDLALRHDPRHPVALANRGILRLRTGDAGGQSDLVAALQADPEGRTAAAQRAQAVAKALTLAALKRARALGKLPKV